MDTWRRRKRKQLLHWLCAWMLHVEERRLEASAALTAELTKRIVDAADEAASRQRAHDETLMATKRKLQLAVTAVEGQVLHQLKQNEHLVQRQTQLEIELQKWTGRCHARRRNACSSFDPRFAICMGFRCGH